LIRFGFAVSIYQTKHATKGDGPSRLFRSLPEVVSHASFAAVRFFFVNLANLDIIKVSETFFNSKLIDFYFAFLVLDGDNASISDKFAGIGRGCNRSWKW
jgi:hypothetical protein